MTIRVRPITEAEFTRQVIQAAKLFGWVAAHFRPGRTAHGWRTPCQADAKGFPDLLLIRPAAGGKGEIMVAELKVGRRQPTKEQSAWLDAFAEAGVPAFVWRPEDWGTVEAVLRDGPGAFELKAQP